MRAVFTRILRLLLVPAVLLTPSLASAQNFVEWSTEARTVLAFKVNPDALQRVLPAGWTSVPATTAGTPGANLNLTLMEREVVLDPQGKPVRSGTARYLVLGAPARNAQTGQTNTVIVGGMSVEGAGAYDVYVTANTARLERSVVGEGDAQARVQESWQFTAASGERIELQLAYRRGVATRAHVDSVLRSAKHPEFQRTYRIDQATDVVRSASTPDRVEQLTFRATGPAFAALFDGKEQLLGVTAIPYYVRDISIP